DLMRFLGNGPIRGDLKVRVTGVVFFDRYHRQSGVASNAVELHPVLAVEALAGVSPAPAPPQRAAGLGPADERGVPESPGVDHTKGRCCKVCKNSQPCGDSCISLAYTCHKDAGCACWTR